MTPSFLYYANLIMQKVNDLNSLFSKITCPVFIAAGKYDFLNPYYMWEKKMAGLQNYSLNIFDRSGHHPELEEKELFIETLDKWLKVSK